MLFRVKRGQHTQDGIVYEANTDHDVVDTDIDLIERFNNNSKFERITIPLDQLEDSIPFKEDVTEKFIDSGEIGLKVYHTVKRYFVIDAKSGKPVHENKIVHSDDVRSLIKGLK